jgi:hypothetical protein
MIMPDLSPEIGTLLIKLPYRVGLYISLSDKTGGGKADEAELRALEQVVTYYVEDFCKSEFAQAIMLETLQNKHDWPNWQADIERVPEDCKKVFDALLDQIDVKDYVAFKNNLLEIAIAVAMAYREFDSSEPWVERFKVYLAILIQRIKLTLKGESLPPVDQMLNISRDEKMAINLLADTLGIEYKVG